MEVNCDSGAFVIAVPEGFMHEMEQKGAWVYICILVAKCTSITTRPNFAGCSTGQLIYGTIVLGHNSFSYFYSRFLNPNYYFFNFNCSNVSNLRNLEEQVKTVLCFRGLKITC